MNRRSALEGLSLGGTAALAAKVLWPARPSSRRRPSNVAVIRCERYDSCASAVRDGLRLVPPGVRGRRVVLKPNLVEHSATAPINTNPQLIAAVADAMYAAGAATVVVADGPGHVRDSELLLSESGLRQHLAEIGRSQFVDLNFDDVRAVRTRGAFTSLTKIWLPNTILNADVIVSMPKVKTHHWAGVTLSLKNLFGVVPGSVYGWPKNILHWQGIDNSIAELAVTLPIHYVIADGIDAMEGNGPLHGSTRHLGALVFADDAVAADATCCRLMGIDPFRVRHLVMAAPFGNLHSEAIVQRGELIQALRQRFSLLSSFGHLQDPA